MLGFLLGSLLILVVTLLGREEHYYYKQKKLLLDNQELLEVIRLAGRPDDFKTPTRSSVVQDIRGHLRNYLATRRQR